MPQKSLLELKIENEPREFAAKIRAMGDIFWWPPGKFWVINSYDYAKQVLTSSDFTCDRSSFFISRMPEMDLSLINDFFAVVSKMMVMSDYPENVQRRRICYDGFTNITLKQLEPIIQQTITKQIKHCLDKNSMEFVSDIAKIVPSTTLAEFFCIPEQERENFYHWSNNMTQFFGGASSYQNQDGIEVNNSAQALRNYFTNLIEDRLRHPSSDFLSILLKNKAAFGLDNDEIISQAIMMLVAGQITTTDQLCNNLYTLLSYPQAFEQLWNNPNLLDTALDELNRLDPAVTFIFRVTKSDTQIGSQKIVKGDVIFISTHGVNHDPNHFVQPDSCILHRINNKQLSYGYGGHYCLGAKLAKLEMKLCFTALIKNFKTITLVENLRPLRKHHSLAFSGFEHLHLQFNN
jgi:cytochrome P450